MMPNEGFGAATPRLLMWLNQYQGMEQHLPWDDELPEAAVANSLSITANNKDGLLDTLRGLTQLLFNHYVLFVQDEHTGAVKQWQPLLVDLPTFDTSNQAWACYQDRPLVSSVALHRYVEAV
jgi:hypothetical protein